MPVELPACGYRNGAGKRIVFCKHPHTGKVVTRSDCLDCAVADPDAIVTSTCQHLLPVLKTVDCRVCGGNKKSFSVYGCQLHQQCVRTRYEYGKIRENQAEELGPDYKSQPLTCCESCADLICRQAGRQQWDDVPPYQHWQPLPDPHPVHFVTTLTDSFSPGLRALLISLQERSQLDEFRFTVVALDTISPQHKAELDAQHDLEWIDRAELAETPRLSTTRPRLAPNFNKLLVWHLPYSHHLHFIDSDCLCVGDLTELQYWGDLTVVRNFARYESRRRSEANYKRRNLPIWNSGSFTFIPDRERGESIVELAHRYKSVDLGDQEILNDWHAEFAPEVVRYADYGYNYRTYLGVKSDIRILHYAHPQKPWRDQPKRRHQQESFALWQSVSSGQGGYEQFLCDFVPGRKG